MENNENNIVKENEILNNDFDNMSMDSKSINEQKSICPNCGFANNINDTVCPECGFSSKPKKNKKKLIIITSILILIVVLVLGILFGFKQIKINKSEQAYQEAVSLEENAQYEKALELYSLVIEEDISNYDVAQNKIEELNNKISYFKNCAKALVAAEISCSYFNSKDIIDIYYAEDNSAYAMMYGNGTVTIIAPFLNTDCTFLISKNKNTLLESQFPVYYNAEFGLYIHGIGVENYTKGWLSSGWNTVTNTYITMAKKECEKADINNVDEYVEKYYETKDVSVFE